MPLKNLLAIMMLTFFCSAALLSTSCRQNRKEEFSCTDPLGCVDIAEGESVRIGVLQALSGSVAPLGEAQLRGLELAIDEQDGRILGHPIQLQIEDTGCTAEGGANAALKIIADPKTVAIYGTTCSGAAAAASQTMSDAGLTMVSGNNSAPFLTSITGKAAPDWQPGYFRTAPNEERAGHAAAEYAYTILDIRKAAVINDGDIYTRGLTDSFRKGFTELGGTIVLDTSVNKGDEDMQPVLTAVIDAGAELLFFPLFQPEGNNIVRQAKTMKKMDDIILMGDGALIQETFLTDVGDMAKGMYFIGPAKPAGHAVDNLTEHYFTKYSEYPKVSYYLSGYDAAGLLFAAIEKTAFRRQDGKLHIGRQALRATLYNTKDFAGVTGSLSCSQYGDCAKAVFNVLRLDDPAKGLQGLENNILHTSGFPLQP